MAAAVATAAVLAWLAWPSSTGLPGAAASTRQYLSFTACLLTDAHGVAAAPAASVWSGMQDSSLATRAKVTYLPVLGPATETAALPYLASLLQRRCNVVLAVGPAQVAAVVADAARFPHVRFVTVGGAGPGGAARGPGGAGRAGTAAHVTPLTTPPQGSVRAAVSKVVTNAVNQASASAQ